MNVLDMAVLRLATYAKTSPNPTGSDRYAAPSDGLYSGAAISWIPISAPNISNAPASEARSVS